MQIVHTLIKSGLNPGIAQIRGDPPYEMLAPVEHPPPTVESRKMHLTMCSTTIVEQLLFYRCTSFLFIKTLPSAPEVNNLI